LIKRLESVIIDLEQQTAPVLIVSHVSVLQALMAYFRQSPPEECMNIEIPMHMVVKFTPSRGGGWVESQHELLKEESELSSNMSDSVHTDNFVSQSLMISPIWGDHVNSSPVSSKNVRNI
jgi:Histidine phosphatase superfamily (branch 1)